MDLYFGNPHSNDFSIILFQIPDSEFQNLTRSTIPLLCYWKNYLQKIKKILEKINCDWIDDSKLYIEYPVKSANNRSKPSFTDLMYKSNDFSVAFEGKWTEPKYKTVEKWKLEGNQKNKEKVLNHWLRLIEKYSTKKEIKIEEVSEVVYQMIHRTASVCSLKPEKAIVVYQIFKDNFKKVDYKNDLQNLVQSIIPQNKLEIWLHTIEMRTTNYYNKINFTVAKNIKNRSTIIRQAILENELFDFLNENFERIL